MSIRTSIARLDPAWRRHARLALDLALVGVAALYLQGFVARNALVQGDLRTYLAAAQAALTGLDPYAPGVLDQVAGRPLFPFVYPPIGLLPFLPLAGVSGELAKALFLGGKVILLAGLVAVWWRRWLPGASLAAVTLLALYGANRSSLWDLAAGNIAIVEAALLWAAFACYVSGRRAAFAALVVAASVFKLAPAAFLLLLLVPTAGAPARPRLMLGAFAALAALVLLPLLVGPASHWRPFWTAVPDATALADSNPSGLGFLTLAASKLGLPFPPAALVGQLLWVGFVAGLALVSLPFVRRLWAERDAAGWVMAAVLLFVLAHPRVMAYGFVVATPAYLYFSPRPFTGRVGGLLLALALSAQALGQQLLHSYSGALIVVYAPFLRTLCLWLLVVAAPASRAEVAPQMARAA